MPAEFAKQRYQYIFEKGLAAGCKVQHIAMHGTRVRRRGLQPEVIDQRKADAQAEAFGHLQGRGDVFQKIGIGFERNAIPASKSAAAVAEKKPTHHGRSAVADVREIGGNSGICFRKADAAMARGSGAEILGVAKPGIINPEIKGGRIEGHWRTSGQTARVSEPRRECLRKY